MGHRVCFRRFGGRAIAIAALGFTGCTGELSDEGALERSSMALVTPLSVTLQNGSAGYAGTSDTTLSEFSPTLNQGTATTLSVSGRDANRRDLAALLRWDLTSIPADATVTAVKLTFQVTDPSKSSFPVYALNRAFDDTSATWLLAAAGTSWETAGAKGATDRNPASLGSLAAKALGSHAVDLNGTGLAIVNGWVASPATNHGFVLASANANDTLVVASSEHATVGYRPQLTVSYTLPVPGTGGASGTGGVTGSGGAGGGGSGGATGVGGTTGTGGSSGFGFFVFSDSHVSSAVNTYFATALNQMSTIAKASAVPTIAAFSLGDHTLYGTSAEWGHHMALATPYLDPTATEFGGALPRYMAGIGNHDIMDGNWHTLWNASFPGQQALGTNSRTEGIYFSATYGNALFVFRDTNTATDSGVPGPQVTELDALLAQSTATFKFVFHHKPAYYCASGGLGMNKASLALLDVAANHDVDAVFTGHSHVYSRTCRMTAGHACTGTGTGTVQLEIGTVGSSTTRALKTTAQVLSAYDASGVLRSYPYTCSTAAGYDKLLGSSRTFVYVAVDRCSATFSAYKVGTSTPFDTWTVRRCP